MNARIINQKELTGECWLVQMQGITACETCEFADTRNCGGSVIRETGKNRKGHEVPLGIPA